jgi:hypothetical protein
VKSWVEDDPPAVLPVAAACKPSYIVAVTVTLMSDRSGCGSIEVASLLAADRCAAAHSAERLASYSDEYVGSNRVVGLVETLTGLGPRQSWELLLDLARPWVIQIPLVDTLGNIGGHTWPTEASAPRHVECRVSPAGQAVLDAEARNIAPVPAGLVNGTLWRGGLQPPLEPTRVIAALRQLRDHPDTPDEAVITIAGPPPSLTGCDVSGDLNALAAGERVMLRQTGRIRLTGNPVPESPPSRDPAQPRGPVTARPGFSTAHSAEQAEARAQLVIESLPPENDGTEVGRSLDSIRLPMDRPMPEGLAARRPGRLLIADVVDLSRDGDPVRFAITLLPGSDPAAEREKLLAHDGLTSETAAEYPAPLATVLRAWVQRYGGEDITDSLTRFENATGQDRGEGREAN